MFRRAAPLAFLALLSCQDYRFNPVGRCLIQPGQVSLPLSGISTADILFVVDDSGSMAPIQASLASNFQSFIQNLATYQATRVGAGQTALDFYIAVTTSGVLVNRGVSATCTSGTCNISTPTFPPARTYACSPEGSTCADVITQYYSNFSSCVPGVAVAAGDPFPAGSFVSLGANPKVLAFTKGLDWPNWQTDATIQGLMGQFGQNIQVGDCGANQEMHLQAGRLAVEKALAGQQSLPAGTTWPHPDSKLVVVWVGNEDDCSTRRADQGGLVWNQGTVGGDSCENQAQLDPSVSLQYPVTDYSTFFIGLGRPLGVAFIRPGDTGCNCVGSCSANGYGNATRFKALASAFRSQGAQVLEASVCGNFGTTLTQLADLVKVPEGLTLPTQPAADVVTQLRLVGSDGKTAYVCSAPSTTGDWWFIDCSSGNALAPGATSACIKLQQNGPCVPSPGQTLVAEYLGRVPSGGCLVGTAGADSQECATALGGSASEWTCDGTTGLQGTCLCKTGP
ncbi:MAG TPA: hypothetical protein VLD85_05515 [Anaeromyxobacteraceae bacterium]|nr:hypothetical protein [Anaeromyxobacteraceae bacterium]